MARGTRPASGRVPASVRGGSRGMRPDLGAAREGVRRCVLRRLRRGAAGGRPRHPAGVPKPHARPCDCPLGAGAGGSRQARVAGGRRGGGRPADKRCSYRVRASPRGLPRGVRAHDRRAGSGRAHVAGGTASGARPDPSLRGRARGRVALPGRRRTGRAAGGAGGGAASAGGERSARAGLAEGTPGRTGAAARSGGPQHDLRPAAGGGLPLPLAEYRPAASRARARGGSRGCLLLHAGGAARGTGGRKRSREGGHRRAAAGAGGLPGDAATARPRTTARRRDQRGGGAAGNGGRRQASTGAGRASSGRWQRPAAWATARSWSAG